MRSEPKVVEPQKNLLESVETTVRQRLGKDRMDLWFGSGTRWSITDKQMILIEVSSEFLANCIGTMFRPDLQAAIVQSAGPDWGCQVVVRQQKSLVRDTLSPPEGGSFAYHGATEIPSPSPPPSSTAEFVNAPATSISSSVRMDDASSVQMDDASSIGADDAACASILAADELGSRRDAPSLRLVRAERTTQSNPSHPAEPELDVDRLVALRRQSERRWEDFLVGEHNRFAYTAAEMVLESPGQINPLLIHGPNGVGKSHLAQALAQRLRQQYRMRRVLQLTGEQFTIEFTESARGGGFANFRRKYRDVEAIVIDDVQFCLGKSGTLGELRNTIDMLLRDRRQVILVADRGLHELAGLGADLYARLSGGMCCGIDPMDATTRKGLLRSMCSKQNISIEDTAVEAIAKQCGGDARILQGIVHRLVAQQRLHGGSLNTDLALRCTSDLVRASQPIVRLNDIERVVCESFGLQEEMLRAKTKCQSVSQPRMLAMFLARKYTRTALSEIGEYFGKRQHSTVISAQRKVEQWLSSDDAIAVGHNRVHVREIVRNLEAVLQVG